MKEKVLIGSPITAVKRYKAYCLEEYLEQLGKLTYPNREFSLLLNQEGGDHLIQDYPHLNIRRMPAMGTVVETCVLARNMLREEVLKEGFDYLLFIEQDIIVPYNLVERLMQHQKEVCSALYFNEVAPQKARHGVNTTYFPMAWSFDNESLKRGEYVEKLLRPEDLVQGRLMHVDVSGLAAVLIRREVLEQIEFRYIDGTPQIFEEFCFGRDCRDKGIDIYLDTSVVCRHYSARGL
ncbi:MAG: hypothetical protein KJ583_06070 [Nanoarchaeota archaeon]|nr:hypothetical protein [Nanoarchaeota archaeon]MBU1270416.1 hypothetical protein [Nanoarchaeota archaeon]MBU1604852.1 hypothetical protein [Nanoarchaeota archaeon]MBU2442458.1 hypothetical protein [Nanoarchaeota archaeon]